MRGRYGMVRGVLVFETRGFGDFGVLNLGYCGFFLIFGLEDQGRVESR